MNVLWSTNAIDSFNQNVTYLQEEWSQKVVEEFLDKVDEAVASISTYPLAFPIYGKHKNIRRCLIVKQITLFYRIKNQQIELLLFWNNYRNPKRLKL